MSAGGTLEATVGVVGARGHVGKELLELLCGHPHFELVYLGSRQLAGQQLSEQLPGVKRAIRFEKLEPEDLAARPVSVCVLALPDGLADAYVSSLEQCRPETIIVDLSSDHRFADDWHYGLPELTRQQAAGARRIANPGCYATGMQLGIAPMLEELSGPPVCYGLSGFSGAGTRPSARNDPELLAENLVPYRLTGHLHEREVTHRLGRAVYFMPHVASFFRGISLTISLPLRRPFRLCEVLERYRSSYGREALIRVGEQMPLVKDVCRHHHVCLGGFSLDESGRRLVVVATLDNLLKGAATQALQNMNLACGFGEWEGIDHD